MNKTKTLRNSLLLLVTALVWGIAFVAQSEGGDAVGPFSFNSIRCLIGSAVLVPVIFLLDKLGLAGRKPQTKEEKKTLWTGGICCGAILACASNLQQLGITMGSTAGKAGFLTAVYILLVPIAGIFLKRRCAWNVWVGVALAVVGLYLLCINGALRLQPCDSIVLVGSVFWCMHILTIEHFSPKVDGVRMSCIQFLVAGLLTAVPMLVHEVPTMTPAVWLQALASWDAWIPILYAGVMSCGVGYTLQIIGQDGLNATVASLIMSLESAFSVLAGWVILHQYLSARELCGCALIFAAVLLAQIPVRRKEKAAL